MPPRSYGPAGPLVSMSVCKRSRWSCATARRLLPARTSPEPSRHHTRVRSSGVASRLVCIYTAAPWPSIGGTALSAPWTCVARHQPSRRARCAGTAGERSRTVDEWRSVRRCGVVSPVRYEYYHPNAHCVPRVSAIQISSVYPISSPNTLPYTATRRSSPQIAMAQLHKLMQSWVWRTFGPPHRPSPEGAGRAG